MRTNNLEARAPRWIADLLTTDEAAAVIERVEHRGFVPASGDYPPSYRNNDRMVIDDPERAAWLWTRLAAQLPRTIVDADRATWDLAGLNPRFRYCRYRAGQEFTIHRDGAHHEGPDRRSFLTVMIYLNGAAMFEGGTTRFYRDRDPRHGISAEITPHRGAAVVFSHALWHDGAPVTGGCKYIMRTDVMYERRNAAAHDGHDGYVWSIAKVGGGQYASGGRDKTLRIWDDGHCIEVLRGHELSVTVVGSDAMDRLWTGCRDGTLRRWQRTAGTWAALPATTAHDGAIVAITNVCQDRFATGSADRSIGIWRTDGALEARLSRHDSWVWALAWCPDGALVSGSEDATIVLADRCVRAGAPVRALAAGPTWVASGDASGTIVLWDLGLHELRRWTAHHGAITALVELPDGCLASASEDGCVSTWDLATGRRVQMWQFADHVRCLAVAGAGSLLSGGYDGMIRTLPLDGYASSPSSMARTIGAA